MPIAMGDQCRDNCPVWCQANEMMCSGGMGYYNGGKQSYSFHIIMNVFLHHTHITYRLSRTGLLLSI